MQASHTDCKYWTYETHPDRDAGLPQRCLELTNRVLSQQIPLDFNPFDTRGAHKFMFGSMTPASCQCIAGNYRGFKDCPDLVDCHVRIDHDRRVGVPPMLVTREMVGFEARCDQIMFRFTEWQKSTEGMAAATEHRLNKFAVEAARMLADFLTIHPYMDGNGHCARFLLFRLATWAGLPPRAWKIDDKLPVYEELSLHRGDRQRGPLIQKLAIHLLEALD